MKRFLRWPLILTIVLALCLGTYGSLKSRRQVYVYLLQHATRGNTELETELRATEKELLGKENGVNALQAQLAKLPQPTPLRTSSNVRRLIPPGLNAVILDAVLTDPNLQKMYQGTRRAVLKAQYGHFFHIQQLSSGQSEKLLDAIITHDETVLDCAATISERSLPPDDHSVLSLIANTNDQLRLQELQILGPEMFGKLQDYEKVQLARDDAAQFAGNAALAGLPLTTVQVDRLTELVDQLKRDLDQRKSTLPTAMSGGPRFDLAEFDLRAAGILTAEQLTFLQRSDGNGAFFRGLRALDAIEQSFRPPQTSESVPGLY